MLNDLPCDNSNSNWPVTHFVCDDLVLGNRIKDLETELAVGQGEIDVVESEVDSIQSDVDDAENRLDTVENDVDGAETAVDTLESEMDTVQSDVDAVESNIDAVEVRLEAVEDFDEQRSFVVVEDSLTWTEANDYCRDTYGTSLATIRNDYDAETLLGLRQELGAYHMWIGLNDMNEEGEWQWVSGYPCEGECDQLEWWNVNEPNDHGKNEDCGHIKKDAESIDVMLNDLPCDNSNSNWPVTHFVCDDLVLGNRVKDLETELAVGQGEIDAVESEVDSVQSNIDAVESDFASLEARVQSLERVNSGLNDLLDAESESVSVPVGFFGDYGDYAIYVLAAGNLVLVVCLVMYCLMARKDPAAKYGKVVMYDTDRV